MEDPLISPSKARRDAAQARDWSYVTEWLAKQYAPHSIPHFERNDDVLQSMLELVAANDAADAEMVLLHRARERDLERFEEKQRYVVDDPVQELLKEVEESLEERGAEALRDLAETSILLGTLRTDAATIRGRMAEVARDEFDTEEQLRRVETIRAYLEREMALLEQEITSLTGREDEDKTEHLRQQTAQLNRDTKQVGIKLGEYKDRIAALERAKVAGSELEDAKANEREALALQKRVKDLEKQLADYQGLPPDLEAAKEEYQRIQRELQSLTRRRDELFDERFTHTR